MKKTSITKKQAPNQYSKPVLRSTSLSPKSVLNTSPSAQSEAFKINEEEYDW